MNPFSHTSHHTSGLVKDMVPVTPNDGADNVGTDNVATGLFVTTGGVVVFDTAAGTTRTVTVPDSFYLVCSVARVRATGTTATGIFALVV